MSTAPPPGRKGPPPSVPFDPTEGSTHPPAIARKRPSPTQKELIPAMRWMRGEMVREFILRLRRKNSNKGGLRKRMRKRKAALTMSAAVMAATPGMVDERAEAPAEMQFALDPTEVRVPVSMLAASDAMKEALAEEEGVRLTVYRDVAGYPTVGVGHLITPKDNLKVGDRISYERALELLEDDLKHAEEGVRRLVGDLKLFQHEFDALVDLVYNVGEGNVSESESPRLNQAIAERDYKSIAEELLYHHAGGAMANGLLYRSERRQAIFLNAAYDDPRPASISVAGAVST